MSMNFLPNNQQLSQWWSEIKKNEATIVKSKYAPFINMQNCLPYFQLTSLNDSSDSFFMNIVPSNSEPSFANLNEEVMLFLRAKLYKNQQYAAVNAWAEKLLRYCEIRQKDIKKLAIKKWKNRQNAQLNMLHLMVFFLDMAYVRDDMRFLNIALKLNDHKWLMDHSKILQSLIKAEQIEITCFQVRVYMMINYLLSLLHEVK